MPAMILLNKREEDAVDANRNHHHVLLPKASRDWPVNNKSGDGELLNIHEEENAAAIWIPPEAADVLEDDEHHHLGDDAWEKERHNAMLKAMSGQLKILAARFLSSAGISLLPLSHGQEEGESCSWLDIVTSLSWEAALLIKPDGGVGKDMDPASYIKVKCLPSGTRRQCEVIKGLVFKKNAAHKHMPTWSHNARLLLLRGALGDSDSGFSSFSSMEQEKDHLQKSVCKMMEICSPNVIMVEKTVSRDVQEVLLNQGATLVLDMKLNRLQRIARFSGSSILSFSEVLTNKPNLKQCDYFHIEKFMEEHNHTAEAGKRTLSKTLMFLEGFHKPSGCTILLRGSNREELKKIKQVMHYTIFAAYHLILETSFFEDQRVFLNNKNPSEEANSFSAISVIHHETPTLSNGTYLLVNPEDNNTSALKLHLETYNGSVERPTNGETAIISSINRVALSSLNKEVPGELLEGVVTGCDSNRAVCSERLASYVSGSRKRFIDMFCHQNIYLPFTSAYETTNHLKEGSLQNNQEVAGNNFHISPKARVPVGSGQNVDHWIDPQKQAFSETDYQSNDPSASEKHEQASIRLENEQCHNTGYMSGDWTSDTDDGDDVLESQSILILMSSQCITKQVICEQSHLSRIKYYGNFDVSLGRYLQDILQSQNLSCSSCGEPPGVHMYSYTHRNGNLTVLVKRLPPRYHLPSASEGKIWMWTRCLKCEHENGISKSSRRVLLSSEAHNLSFGKFLELSFSSHSAARRLSICGHLVNRDCLRFFGLGSKVAMFQYSSVQIYTACKPQPTLEFHNPSMHEWYEQERRNVLARGAVLFSEVRRLLLNVKDQFLGVVNNSCAFLPIEEFSYLEEMLIKEKSEFMDSVTKSIDISGTPSSVHEILNVNWLYQDLLLELYVWDRRLHQLLRCSISAEMEEVENSEFTGDQTAADKPSLENGFMEPEKLRELGTTLVDEEQHGTNFDTSLKQLRISRVDDREKWVWNPLYESRLAYRQEVQVGFLERFQLINHYSPSHLSPLHKQSAKEEFIVGPGGSVLCVSEDEISSIISRALAVSEERRQLLDAIIESEAADIRGRERTKTMEKSDSCVSETSASSCGSSDSEAGFSSDDLFSYDSTLLPSSVHPEISVNGKRKYSVICVYADQFYNLRKKCCPSELAYITSLSRCKRWDAQGGKSKAFFAKTMDDRFIVKQIKKTEFESFIEFAPDYFKHVCHSLDTGSQTCLAKILGIYQVKQIRHSKEVKIDLMVMENLLFGHNVSRAYDLKGVVFSRHVSHSNDHGTVYLDQNFVEDMRVSPIYIGGRTKHLLQRAIWNDTSFLTSINVMDYSLLVGVDKHKHEFVFGIIDYLRQYTWDKQLETWVKTSLVVPKNVSPTVISPGEYKKRFRKFMAKYFLAVPDDWSSENSTVPCESCDHSNSKLPPVNDEKSQHQSVACLNSQ